LAGAIIGCLVGDMLCRGPVPSESCWKKNSVDRKDLDLF